MTADKPEELLATLVESLSKVLQSSGALQHMGIPDYVRVSPKLWKEFNSEIPETIPTPLPFGLRVELDEALTGDVWELGPRMPSEAKPSAANSTGRATDSSEGPE